MGDKQLEEVTQSIVDRCILDEAFKFMVHILPCSFNFPEEHKLIPRKRKMIHCEEVGSMFLTPVLAQSPIVLTPTQEDAFDGKSYNSSPFWRSLLKQSGRVSPGGSLSSSPSPIAMLERKFPGELGMPSAKRIAEFMPKAGRPRSKSTATDKPKKKTPSRSRSKSSDQKSGAAHSSSTFTPINFNPDALSFNMNNNNNNSNVSPPGGNILSLPQFKPLPITPPRNPYEDQPIMDRKLDPKTLRHLQLN